MRNPFYQKKAIYDLPSVFYLYLLLPLINFSILFVSLGDALEQNFVFSSLDNVEKQMLANAMERISVCEGEDVITQGIVIFFCFLSIY